MTAPLIVTGNPWSVLPIKNMKYAKNLTEVHLADREVDILEQFEDFPNLEVAWVNNNKVRYISSNICVA
jgi:hypothetical protein